MEGMHGEHDCRHESSGQAAASGTSFTGVCTIWSVFFFGAAAKTSGLTYVGCKPKSLKKSVSRTQAMQVSWHQLLSFVGMRSHSRRTRSEDNSPGSLSTFGCGGGAMPSKSSRFWSAIFLSGTCFIHKI